jgi:hypothetical protein
MLVKEWAQFGYFSFQNVQDSTFSYNYLSASKGIS